VEPIGRDVLPQHETLSIAIGVWNRMAQLPLVADMLAVHMSSNAAATLHDRALTTRSWQSMQ
jgi:hypothetical protein